MSALPVDPHLYLTFLGVMVVMAITPGPANLFAVAAGVERGRAPALIGVVGIWLIRDNPTVALRSFKTAATGTINKFDFAASMEMASVVNGLIAALAPR